MSGEAYGTPSIQRLGNSGGLKGKRITRCPPRAGKRSLQGPLLRTRDWRQRPGHEVPARSRVGAMCQCLEISLCRPTVPPDIGWSQRHGDSLSPPASPGAAARRTARLWRWSWCSE